MEPSSVQPLRCTAAWQRQFIPLDRAALNDSDADAQVELGALCSKCQPIRKWFQENWEKLAPVDTKSIPLVSFDHHESGRLLEASYRNGCHLCTLIWEGLMKRQFHLDHPLRDDHHDFRLGGDRLSTAAREKAEEYCRECGSLLVIAWPDKKFARGFLNVKVKSRTSSTAVESGDPIDMASQDGIPSARSTDMEVACEIVLSRRDVDSTGELTPINTRSQPTMNLIRGWLSSCQNSHEGCSLPPGPRALPTRLLRIFSLSTGDTVRLVETKNLTEVDDLKYSTLSYCWGGKAKVELMTSNIGSIMEGIQASQLSRTIEDAIWVTKNLGLEFIWVDSLCIIQDSSSDWAREAAGMSDVYRNCFFSIAARAAWNAREGLFCKRDPFQYSYCFLTSDAGGRNIVALSETQNGVKRHIVKSPLDTRGWVVQERLLAPRIIRFGPYISWICPTAEAAEFGLVEAYHIRKAIEVEKKNTFFRRVLYPPARQVTDTDTLYSVWQDILEEYSAAELSFKSDRLFALTGVITAFQERTGWSPMAGLWDHGSLLLRGLLWRVVDVVTNPQRTGLRPTWSWVAVDCEIDHRDRYWAYWPGFHIEDFSTRPVKETKTLATIITWPCDGNAEALKIFSAILKAGITGPGPFQHNPTRCREITICNWSSKTSPVVMFDIDVPAENTELMLVPLLNVKSSMGGLVIERSKKFPDCFERLGYWEVVLDFLPEETEQELSKVLEYIEQNREEGGIILI